MNFRIQQKYLECHLRDGNSWTSAAGETCWRNRSCISEMGHLSYATPTDRWVVLKPLAFWTARTLYSPLDVAQRTAGTNVGRQPVTRFAENHVKTLVRRDFVRGTGRKRAYVSVGLKMQCMEQGTGSSCESLVCTWMRNHFGGGLAGNPGEKSVSEPNDKSTIVAFNMKWMLLRSTSRFLYWPLRVPSQSYC